MSKELDELKRMSALLDDIRENGFKTVEVPFEESVMGQIHRDLENQAEEIAKNSGQENSKSTKKDTEADVDRRKKFRDNVILTFISAAATAFFANLERIWQAFLAFIQRLF